MSSLVSWKASQNAILVVDLFTHRDSDLADPEYSINCKVDVLLGVDYYASCMQGRNVHSDSMNMVACDTIFGWTLTGAGDGQQPTTSSEAVCCTGNPRSSHAETLALEEVPGEDSSLTADELTAVMCGG